MAEEPDVIREQIDQTRSALTQKLETLEGQVRETVQNAKETVEGTIENVKSSVQETVATVKRTFDLRYQVDRHPWGMMAGSFLTGCVLGYWTEGRRTQARLRSARVSRYLGPSAAAGSEMMSASAPLPRMDGETAVSSFAQPLQTPRNRAGWFSQLRSQFGDEIDKVKGVAIGAALGLVRDLAAQSLPKLAPQIEDVMNRVTTKLGGEPTVGPLVEPEASGASCAHPQAWH